MLKPKRQGVGLEIRTFQGNDDRSYVVFRTPRGAYHTFIEVEAKQAARECGATTEGNTRSMWDDLWTSESGEIPTPA